MKNLFNAELIRFRGLASAAGALHLLIIGLFSYVVDLAQQPLAVYRVFAGVHVVAGLLFGLYQMSGYRRPNMWLHLLHRPLSPQRIGFAVLGAGVLLLAAASALPMLALCGWQDVMTARVVDIRHWLMPIAAALLAACGYLAGVHCILANKRYSMCALVFFVLLAFSRASGWGALVFQTLIAIWLGALAITAFKPNLTALPRSAFGVIATAAPLQLSIYVLLFALSAFASDLYLLVQGSHPNIKPRQGGYVEALRADSRDLLRAGLAASAASEASIWREQVSLSEVFEMPGKLSELPIRGTLTNPVPMEFDDNRHRVRWVFSHDSMRFKGRSLVDGRAAGVLGVGTDNARFSVPPQPPSAAQGNDFSLLLGGNTLYRYDVERSRIQPLVQLPRDEMIAAPPRIIGERVAILSNRALYFFDRRDALQAAPVPLRLRAALPGKIGNLSRITLIELVDGYLASFTFARGARVGEGAAFQQVVQLREGGQVEVVARREFLADYSSTLRYMYHRWLSPLLRQTFNGATSAFSAPAPLQEGTAAPTPREIWVLAFVLSLLSALGALWRTAQSGMSRRIRIAWVVASGMISLPAMISLWLMYPERVRSHEALSARSATVQ